MWCHLLLGMPLFGLALFLVLPWPLALAAYLPIAAASFLIYYLAAKALRRPVQSGTESMVGATGEVIALVPRGGLASHLVRCRGETWSVRAREPLATGDPVRIVGFEGAWPIVERFAGDVDGRQVAGSRCH